MLLLFSFTKLKNILINLYLNIKKIKIPINPCLPKIVIKKLCGSLAKIPACGEKVINGSPKPLPKKNRNGSEEISNIICFHQKSLSFAEPTCDMRLSSFFSRKKK